MTPHSLRCGLAVFIATDAHGVVRKRCVASTRALAEAAIGGPGVSVVSAASPLFGIPERVKQALAIRLCALCVKPLEPRASPFARYHSACFQRHRLSGEATQARRKAKRTGGDA